MMTHIRAVEAALGDGRKIPAPCESNTAEVARRSVVAGRALAAGTTLTAQDLAVKRPGTGILPKYFEALIGRTLARSIDGDEPLQWSDFS
jgi:sialic acid synthase SpsE